MKKYMNSLFKRTFLSLIMFFLFYAIFKNNNNLLLNSYIDFSYVNSKTNILFGSVKKKYVNSEKLQYKKIEKYNNSFKIITDNNYVINNIKEGTVIYIGNKENLSNTIIINSTNGINYWYSNIENISVNLYDYVDTNSIIGNTINDYFYLTLTKNGKYLNYEEYI